MSHHKNPSEVGQQMPKTIVKIVGSKYMRCPVDRSECCPGGNRENFLLHLKGMLSGISNINSFRGSLLRRDRTLCGLLSIPEFLSVCESHGLSISPSSLLPLLEDDGFTDQGKIRWRKIVDLLNDSTGHGDDSTQKDGEVNEDSPVCSKEPEIQMNPQLLDSSQTSEGLPLGGLRAPQRGSRPASEPAFHLFEGSCDEGGAWIDRFTMLEKVLWLCQIKDSGLVEVERARQILRRYNALYGLSLSGEKIEEALEKFGSGGHVTLGPMLHFLKEL
ncbi:uncharacterized protein C1orf87 homolog [Pyxicephalus adspersus]|uniref:uncharacterized protein C1orf87 homolog n=1 Tax=Pyxicephalus adspersus TaxID=30357 RepID=UPI003B5A340B